jgi:hypothetical protein
MSMVLRSFYRDVDEGIVYDHIEVSTPEGVPLSETSDQCAFSAARCRKPKIKTTMKTINVAEAV